MHRFCILIFSFCVAIFAISATDNKFNRFKSYKDSKYKPIHYGNTEQRNHDVEEYLSPIQKDMYNIRKSPNRAEHMFDSKWSGFHNKSAKKRAALRMGKTRQLQHHDDSTSTEQGAAGFSFIDFDYVQWGFFLFIGGSIGWVFYILESRKNLARTATLRARRSLSDEIREDIETTGVSTSLDVPTTLAKI